ncbi:hypothetical protein ASG40_11560 [Methylobacterium sp. Leaf399]|uniref:hypothetical protein n=1 Tax=Methylobacterium sp. Leaf399 TaxID=1736364 RepID=UPI0006F52461|nr:hypothetical protein [Methylobacterium sp. Leaf399]KQT08510.1 hypothetical protein ASG40_11560 [Methylobacterium sp. Leaf399]
MSGSDADLCLCAIDPGLTGAVAFYFPAHPERLAVEDMPTVNGEVNVLELERCLRAFAPALAVVEIVNAMPSIPGPDGKRRKMGAASAFNFGAAFSAAKATVQCCHVPMHLVHPKTWRSHFRLKGGEGAKELSRGEAIRLFPASADRFRRKADHNRAEAALLARFAAETING